MRITNALTIGLYNRKTEVLIHFNETRGEETPLWAAEGYKSYNLFYEVTIIFLMILMLKNIF